MQRLKALSPLLLLILVGIVLFASGALDSLRPERLIGDQNELRLAIAASPWLSRLAFIGMITLSVATGVPGTIVLILAGGMLFGVAEGTVWSAIGLVAGSLLLFLASRYAFRDGQRQPPKLVERLRHGFLAHPASYTLFLRLVPVFPFGAVTVALAWLRCPLWIFLGASAFGGTVMLIFETAIGAGLAAHVASDNTLSIGLLLDPHIALPLLALAVLALIPVALGRRRNAPAPP
ncbi:MAG TPA: VTT domain-containing protein [Rhodanobacteraceae bacterium]|nr:VTT domain-containing protein [Rhodanobacteraceae bacterium]